MIQIVDLIIILIQQNRYREAIQYFDQNLDLKLIKICNKRMK